MSKDNPDGGDDNSDDDGNEDDCHDNKSILSLQKSAVKTEKKEKEKGNKVSTPKTASTKGSSETTNLAPIRESSNISTKDKKQDVVTETITTSHAFVSNIIPGLVDTPNKTS